MNIRFFVFFVFLTEFLISATALRVPISGTIDMGLPNYVNRGIEFALEDSVEYIIFDIDTFGGRVDAATKIKDVILASNVKTIAFINRRAISAGALIALSCDSIFMTPGSTIGAATAVSLDGEKASEKVISYMREEMASTAEATFRSRQIAEAMVDEEISIPFYITTNGDTLTSLDIEGFKKDKLITLSTKNAKKIGIISDEANSFDSLIKVLGVSPDSVFEFKESWSESLVRFLTNPNVAPLFMSLGMLGLFFEIKSPGFGIPGIAGLLCLFLFFGSHLLVGLADTTEILFLFMGIVLIVLEIVVIPGFGIAGISGFFLILYSIFQMMLGDYPMPIDIYLATRSLSFSFISMIIFGILIFKALTNTEYYKKLIPITSQLSKDGYSISKGYESLIGKSGETITVLRPVGKIRIDDRVYQAISNSNFIEISKNVVVISIDENQLIVTEKNT